MLKGVAAIFRDILRTGFKPELSLLEQNALLITNIGLVIALTVNSLLMVFTPEMSGQYGLWTMLVYLAAACSYLATFFFIRRQHYVIGRTLFSVTLIVVITTESFLLGTASGIHMYFFPIGIGAVLIWPRMRMPQCLMAGTALMAFVWVYVQQPAGYILESNSFPFSFAGLSLVNYVLSFLTTLTVVFSMVIATEQFQGVLEELRIKANQKAMNREEQMMASLNALALARDNETGNHIVRTQYYVKVLADRLIADGHYQDQMNSRIASLLFKAAPLHDIGKIGIPDHVLLKPGQLTDAEWEIMKTHTTIGESVLLSAELQTMSEDGSMDDVVMVAVQIAGCHHERWDGTGYPRGLAGCSIPLPARIMSIADMYDALISERVYKKSWTHDQAVQEIVSKSGSNFDPVLVQAFLADKDKFQSIADKFKD